jgi:hypothetical protein
MPAWPSLVRTVRRRGGALVGTRAGGAHRRRVLRREHGPTHPTQSRNHPRREGQSSDPARAPRVHVAFFEAAIGQRKFDYRPELTAESLIEGNLVEGGGFNSGETENPFRSNVAVRRNVAARCNTPFFFSSVHGLLIEENVIYRPSENGGEGNHAMYITRLGNEDVTTRGNLIYYGPTGTGEGIQQRPGGVSEGNVVSSCAWASLDFGACGDGNGGACAPPVTASVVGNLVVEGGGIAFQHDFISSGEARDNISADVPNNVDPIDAPSIVTQAGNVTLDGPVDSARPSVSLIGLYSADVLRGEATTVAFFEQAIQQRKFNYREELTAASVIAHVRETYAP